MWRHGLFQWNPFARVACHGPGFDAELIVVKDGALNMPLSWFHAMVCFTTRHHPAPLCDKSFTELAFRAQLSYRVHVVNQLSSYLLLYFCISMS